MVFRYNKEVGMRHPLFFCKKFKITIQLEMKLEERNPKSKVLYNRLNLIMAFCNQLPELFRLATPEIKKEISLFLHLKQCY